MPNIEGSIFGTLGVALLDLPLEPQKFAIASAHER
ncbi:hypothetical protein ABIF38_004985 [Bradyrhizobium japonicum]|nr:hypothetical protein [Bradyrhizobium elkanii]MCS3568040.1 hypothetical protein [Bradyrhizobium elkanii]MCS3590477.1 hypothetical protein [Bradyrhizobium elkanii]MCS3619920.1 hypothetical protein [Bradyrhizobium elkanii]MCW2111830.1 hypothetical protein [Bradyrhizobium elkanii]